MNRFLLAKQLNHGDELVWYKRTKTKNLKCTWRRLNPVEGNSAITFLAQHCIYQVSPDGHTSLVTDKTHVVYTRNI